VPLRCIATTVDEEGVTPRCSMRTDPFRELDRLTQQVFGNLPGTWSRPTAMPMDAYRVGDEFVVALDLPGVVSVGTAMRLVGERRPPRNHGRRDGRAAGGRPMTPETRRRSRVRALWPTDTAWPTPP